jgi:hypothetical protein
VHIFGILEEDVLMFYIHVNPSLGEGEKEHNVMQFISSNGRVFPTHTMRVYRGN